MNVSVIGLGAMGGGIARALLKSSDIESVRGYDISDEVTRAFYEEAQSVSKENGDIPESVSDVILPNQIVILVLVNEDQCEQVTNNILRNDMVVLPKVVVSCSTVRATFARKLSSRYEEKGVGFVDCPISGGPIRALQGQLSLMISSNGNEQNDGSSSQKKSLVDQNEMRPLWKAMAGSDSNIHVLDGGCGMGSTAKMVHQLLAGVHIVAAAEALTLASQAGLNPSQMYDIVNGAAGHSWMFQDRGSRMIIDDEVPVKSALNIFVKDMNIVHSESSDLQCPVPLATAARQKFLSGKEMGLGTFDDSQVIKVYQEQLITNSQKNENITKNLDISDVWIFDDGIQEEIMEVGDEPRHNVVISNEYTRVMKVNFPPGDTTCAHRHSEDSLYFFLVEGGLNVIHHAMGSDPNCDCMEFGEVRYGTHRTDKPLVHKIKNVHPTSPMNVVDAEILKRPPVTSPLPMVAEYHKLIKTRDKCRVYHLILPPGESTTLYYSFFYISVVIKGSSIQRQIPLSNNKHLKFEETLTLGQVEWNKPTLGVRITNNGTNPFEEYIAEWC